jgi:putative CocE/NonD family hydrolase
MHPLDDSGIDLIHNVRIPMRDGVRLAGNLYRPAMAGRFPCIVNYIPYHKDGRGGLGYADVVHRHFAQRDYAALVLDFRGLGASEGHNITPFDSQEGRDGHDAVEWVAAQPWCDGNVGMWGVSYGGITALKTASQRPPHLRAIVPIHATADNFLDFLLLGGCRGGFWSNGDWGPRMIAHNLTPPLGEDPDGALARLWAQRLESFVPWPLEWYWHAEEAVRWAERAIAIERITAATYAVCGWQDFYAQGTVDYFHRLSSPKRLLIGPWKHVFPNLSAVEPVNFLERMDRWWDRWLRGDLNGIDTGPPITVFVQGSGVWRDEEAWPPQRNESRALYLLAGQELDSRPPREPDGGDVYRHDPTVGLASIGSDPWTTAVSESGGHDDDDVRSLCFTTEPLAEDWEATGQAHALLYVEMTPPGFNLVAKLCDVGPDGRSTLVTMGWSAARPEGPRTAAPVTIPLRATAHLFRRGHRIRLGVALADFPRLWPTPEQGEVRVLRSAGRPSRLILPHTPPQLPTLPLPEFAPLEMGLRAPAELESTQSWQVGRELVHQTAFLECRTLSKYQLNPSGTVCYVHHYTASLSSFDPAGAVIRSSSEVVVHWPKSEVRVRTANVFSPTSVVITAEIDRDGAQIYRKRWETK